MPRTFVGWPLPEDVRLRIEAITSRLRDDLPRASWTRPETYHLTFAFLGDQEEETIERLGMALIETIRQITAATASTGDPGFFPSARRPRVGWLGLTESEPVEHLARLVRDVVAAEKIELDTKPFRPHLTIVRSKAPWRSHHVERFMSSLGKLRGIPLLVDSVVLFESRLGSHGARHIPRFVAKCGKNSDE